MKEEKERLDVLLVKRGLAESREKAKAVIMAGEVFVNNQRERQKPDRPFRLPQPLKCGAKNEVCQPRRLQTGKGHGIFPDCSE